MTSMERETRPGDVARAIRGAVGARGSTMHLRETADHWIEATGTRGARVRDRARAAALARADHGSRRRLRGLRVALRSLGMVWTALMLSTLTVALLSRAKTREESAALEPDADEIRLRTALGPMAFTSRARALRGGVVDCWYGGGFVDLREATLDPAGAVLRVRAVFGAGQIVVPDTWRVIARVRGIGGLNDGRPRTELPEDAPQLTIVGVALFGGFAVQSELPEAEMTQLRDAVARETRRTPRPATAVPAA
jgi:hypothetical protein